MSAATCTQPAYLYAHGLPSWNDLHTGRADRAREFYRSLLGWTFERRAALALVPDLDQVNGRAADFLPEAPALLAKCGDQPVAEIVERSEPFESMNQLSSWFPYVYVDDIEATVELVEPAGGVVVSPPGRRADLARVATILDPSGALLCLWEPATSVAAPPVRQPGTASWIELETADPDEAAKFYGTLFGWDAGEVAMPDSQLGCGDDRYLVFTRHGEPVAGVVVSPVADLRASWCTSFAVTDTDEATTQAVEAGAVVLTEPTEMPLGRQAVLVDPVGAVFALLGPATSGPRPL